MMNGHNLRDLPEKVLSFYFRVNVGRIIRRDVSCSPILFTIPEISMTPQVSPVSRSIPTTPVPVDVIPPTLNPAASIEELLRHYGVQPGPIRIRIPPPPARAIFPPEKVKPQNFNRVHVRHRPGSSRQFSRSSTRTLPRGHAHLNSTNSLGSQQSTRSDTSSDVLGLTPLYEETGEIPSPFLRRPRGWYTPLSNRPDTAGSNVPRLRRREGIAEVVSCSTQTSPPPSPVGFMPDLQGRGSLDLNRTHTDIRESEIGEIESGVVRKRSRRRRKRSRGYGKEFNSTNDVVFVKDEPQGVKSQRRRTRDKGTQSVDKSASTPLSQEHPQSHPHFRHNSSLSQDLSPPAVVSSSGNVLEISELQYQTHDSRRKGSQTSQTSSDYTGPLMGAAPPHAASRKYLREIDPHHLQRAAAKGQYRKSRSNSVPLARDEYFP